jgi:pilus assembly protein CpaE
MRKVKILVASRSREAAQVAQKMLEKNSKCRADIRVISNGHIDPLHGISEMPDLLLLCDLQAEGELKTLVDMAADSRPELVVFGAGDTADEIRLAMRAGARDYLTLPLDEQELNDIVQQVADELNSKDRGDLGSLHVFINGKGGSGASFLATNIAHGLACNGSEVTLVDLDLQFAGLCRYLDVTPTRDLLEAVRSVGDMDEISAEAFACKHHSGLRLLSAATDNLHLNNDISPEDLVSTLQTYQSYNDFVIVDLPRHIDLLSEAVLRSADRISIVIQQSFPHLHDTARLLQILRETMGISESKLNVVVNRYSNDAPILMKDIESTLNVSDIVKIPNHYRLTAESVNAGVPLTEVKKRASVTQGVRDFCQSIDGVAEEVEVGGKLSQLLHPLNRLLRR